jgi:hypothetical protein
VLQGVVGGEFMCCQRQSKTVTPYAPAKKKILLFWYYTHRVLVFLRIGFPVLSRISGYSEVRSKHKVIHSFIEYVRGSRRRTAGPICRRPRSLICL